MQTQTPNANAITARLVSDKGRARLRADDGRFVQCSRDWRETLSPGAALSIRAHVRADGKCWVFLPLC